MLLCILVPENKLDISAKNIEYIQKSTKLETHIFYLKKNNVFKYQNHIFNNINFFKLVYRIFNNTNHNRIIFHSSNFILNNLMLSNNDLIYTFDCKNNIEIDSNIYIQNQQIIENKKRVLTYLYNHSFLSSFNRKSFNLLINLEEYPNIQYTIFYYIKYLNKIGCSITLTNEPAYQLFEHDNKMQSIVLRNIENIPINKLLNKKIIYFSLIGKKGRLGNQLFQYALMYKIHKLTQRLIYFPINYDIYHEYNLNYFPNIEFLILKNNIDKFLLYNIKETDFSYQKNLIDNIKKNNSFLINIDGFFQSPKYFHDIRTDILNIFNFSNIDLQLSEKLYRNMVQSNEISVSLHIRRGDYLKYSNYHFILPLSYYRNCIDFISKKIKIFKIIIFSDDILWCKQNMKFNYPTVYSENNSQIIDLTLMSLCNHNIIANSSFSWWGAYLNKNKNIVLCPNKWFGKNGPKTHDLFLDTWNIIPVENLD